MGVGEARYPRVRSKPVFLLSIARASPPTKLLPCSSITISQKTERGDPPRPQVPPPRPVLLLWLLRCHDARAAGLGGRQQIRAGFGKAAAQTTFYTFQESLARPALG